MDKSKSRALLAIAILAVSFVSQLNSIASVIMADLMELFPDAGPTAIQMVMQFGMIGGFPVSLIVGFLTRKFRIKPMICIGLAATFLGGIAPIIFHSSLVQLYISAVIVGAGLGVMPPLLSTSILDNFEDKASARMIGLNTTFGTGGSAALTLLAGVICLGGWVNTYYLYFVALPAFIFAVFFMPAGDKPVPAPTGEKTKIPVPGRAWVMAIFLLVIFIGYTTFPINVGMLVAALDIGDAASTGLSISIITVVGALFGLVFQPIVKAVKSYIGAFTCFFGTAGMIIVCFAGNMPMIYVASVVLGIFFGASVAGAIYIVGRMCSPEQFGPSFSIIMSFMTLGFILSPILVNIVTPLWGGEGSLGAFTTSSVILGITFVGQLIWGAWLRKAYPESPQSTVTAAA